MSSSAVLLGAVLAFWTLWAAVAMVAKRSWLPVIPLFPMGLLLLGWTLNFAWNWSGTIAVCAVQLALLIGMVWEATRRPGRGGPK